MGARVITVGPLAAADLVAVAQCIAIDAEAFPYASAQFGIKSRVARAWVAREEGARRVVGFVVGQSRHGVLHIPGLAVDRGLRRRGIGRALIRTAIAHARGAQLSGLELHVSVTNRAAIALYRSEGFDVRGRLRDFYPAAAFDGEGDAYAMGLTI